MSRSARGNRRGARGAAADVSVTAASDAPADTATVLEAVRANPALRTAHVIVRDLILKGIESVPHTNLRSQMAQTLEEMLAGKLGFKALLGACTTSSSLPPQRQTLICLIAFPMRLSML